MNDTRKHTVGVYSTRSGALVLLTERQETALQRACVWQTLGYRFLHYDFAEPTHSDADIVSLCAGYKFIAHIGMLHQQYRSPDAPLLVLNPKKFEPSAACANFTDAVKCARELFRCDVVTVPASEFKPEFDCIAAHWRIAILVV